jgi:hypothetical protein
LYGVSFRDYVEGTFTRDDEDEDEFMEKEEEESKQPPIGGAVVELCSKMLGAPKVTFNSLMSILAAHTKLPIPSSPSSPLLAPWDSLMSTPMYLMVMCSVHPAQSEYNKSMGPVLFLHVDPFTCSGNTISSVTLKLRVVTGSGPVADGDTDTGETDKCSEYTKTVTTGKPTQWTVPLSPMVKQSEVLPFDELTYDEGGYDPLELLDFLYPRSTTLKYISIYSSAPIPKIAIYQPLQMVCNGLFYSGDVRHQLDACKVLSERPLGGEQATNNTIKIDSATLPCKILLSVLSSEHIRGPFTPLVRCQAAKSAAVWMLNKAPATQDDKDDLNDIWCGLDGLTAWYRKAYLGGVPVVRAIGKLKSDRKRDLEGEAKVGKGSEWEYIEGPLLGAANLYDLSHELDEEHHVRTAVFTSVCCVRAKDKNTPKRAIQFAIEALTQGLEVGGVSVPGEVLDGLPTEYAKELGAVAGKVDLSRDTALALLSLCFLNCSSEADFKDLELRLMGIAHKRLERELYLIHKEGGEGEEKGKPWVASACMSALVSLGVLRKGHTIGAVVADEGVEIKKSDLATSSKFYEGIYHNFSETGVKAGAAQAYCIAECVLDHKVKDKQDPLRLLGVLEWLLGKMEETSDGVLASVLSELMYDCCSGKIATTQRASIYAIRGFRSIGALDWINNGPLGSPYGDEAIELGGRVKDKVNNGCREGMKLIRKAGDESTFSSGKFEVGSVKRVARFAQRLGEALLRPDMEGRGLDHLWQVLWPVKLGGCSALIRAGKESWDDVWDFEEGKEEEKKRAATTARVLKCMEELGKLNDASNEDDKKRSMLAQMKYEYDLSEYDRVGTTLNQKPSMILKKDQKWQAGGWAGSASLQRKKEMQANRRR